MEKQKNKSSYCSQSKDMHKVIMVDLRINWKEPRSFTWMIFEEAMTEVQTPEVKGE